MLTIFKKCWCNQFGKLLIFLFISIQRIGNFLWIFFKLTFLYHWLVYSFYCNIYSFKRIYIAIKSLLWHGILWIHTDRRESTHNKSLSTFVDKHYCDKHYCDIAKYYQIEEKNRYCTKSSIHLIKYMIIIQYLFIRYIGVIIIEIMYTPFEI